MPERRVHPIWSGLFEGRPIAEHYRGLNITDALERAKSEGVTEIRELDAAEPGLLRGDLRSDRLNLLIIDGIIVDARWG
jgi:hypothetical protein